MRARPASAREEADGLVRTAVVTAQRKGDQILAEASGQASRLKQKAEEESPWSAGRRYRRSEGNFRLPWASPKVVVSWSVEIQPKDHEAFVDEFIRNRVTKHDRSGGGIR